MDRTELHRWLGVARTAASLGASILKRAWERGDELVISTKGSSIDLVTQYDRASEQAVVSHLRDASPFEIVAEEGAPEERGDVKWVVDPLDGTTNFSHGFPFFCVSVALVEGHRPLVGVVNAPALGMEFWAVRGGGAYLNGSRLVLRDGRFLSSSLVAFGCGYDRHEHPERYVPPFEAFMTRTQGMRRLGSAAIDCCLVARGWVDAYFEVNLKPWDLAAGALIAEEAGATVTDTDGSPFDPFTGRVVMARPTVHAQMMEVIASEGLFATEK